MCGITGYFSYQNKVQPKSFYQAHLLLKHRGPDDEGFVSLQSNNIEFLRGDDSNTHISNQKHISESQKTNLLLGHRRLSIIDLSTDGHQPFEFEGLYLTYNGEIYNYIELRDKLKIKGYSFQTQTDTEVFLKAYHCWGVEAFNKFNGMWAAGIYHKEDNKLLLTRDRFGIKPLYYSYQNNELFFASEVKFIRKFIKTTLNKKVAQAYLDDCLLDYSKETFFNEINELEPAHFLEFNNENIQIKKYWIFQPKIDKSISYDEAKQKVAQLFDKSIDYRMRADVEVGSLLSGGLDSNAIVGNLNHRNKMADIFHTFTADFKEKAFSEKEYVDETIKSIPKLKPHFIYPNPDELEDKLNDILYYQEFPFRSLAIFSQYEIYQYIAKNTNVKVLLNGQGSDEQFAGYSYHYFYALVDYLKQGKIKSFISMWQVIKKNRNISNINLFKNILKLLINKEILNKKMFSEFQKTPLREYLRYEDRMSMMTSKETRLPFMDKNLIEYSFSLQNSYKINEQSNKRVLRDVVGYVVKKIVDRTDKQGFVSPQENWQQQELKLIMIKTFEDANYQIMGKNIKQIVDNYFQNKNNEIYQIWRWFCFLNWQQLNFRNSKL
jgi:asparagine synthase (glutamine-hydrolysing)